MSSLVKILAVLICASVLLISSSRYQSFQVMWFSFQKLIQKHSLLLDFLTKRTRAVQGAWLCLIKPLARLLRRYCFIIYSSLVVILYKRLKLRSCSGFLSTILWLYDQCGGSVSNATFKKTSRQLGQAAKALLRSSLSLGCLIAIQSLRIQLILYKLILKILESDLVIWQWKHIALIAKMLRMDQYTSFAS